MESQQARPREPAPETARNVDVKVVSPAPEEPRPQERGVPWIRWAAVLLTVFLGYQLLVIVGGVFQRLLPVLLLIVFGALLAFLLAPLVRRLESVGLGRTVAALLVYLAILAIVVISVSLLSGPASTQTANLVKRSPVYLDQARQGLSALDRWAVMHGLPDLGLSEAIQPGALSVTMAGDVLSGAVGIVTTFATSLINIVIVFVIGFYLLRDGPALRGRLRQVLPVGYRARYDFVAEAVSFVVGGYVRAQVTMAVIIGTLAGVGCWALGVPYPVVIGITVGLLELIPIIGALLGSLLAIGIAVLTSLHLALAVIAYFIVIHFLEAYVLGPRITGVRVNLHPLMALLAMLIGVELAGLLGALFAVPIAGLANVFIRAFYFDIRAHNPTAFGALPATASPRASGWRRVWAQLRLRRAEHKLP
jgi:predicted PurR-regulated permease PerM